MTHSLIMNSSFFSLSSSFLTKESFDEMHKLHISICSFSVKWPYCAPSVLGSCNSCRAVTCSIDYSTTAVSSTT